MLLKKTFLAPFWWMLVLGVITGRVWIEPFDRGVVMVCITPVEQ